ncbi:hypothetical protein E2I00_012203, partial [Balaenoptera physalus]
SPVLRRPQAGGAAEAEEFNTGPLFLLAESVNHTTQVLTDCRNKKFLGQWEGDVDRCPQEWQGKQSKHRYISKVFLCGVSVIMVLWNPLISVKEGPPPLPQKSLPS